MSNSKKTTGVSTDPKNPDAVAPDAGTETPTNDLTTDDPAYYPEDERPCLDYEDDHSTTDFDMNEELDAKLGKAEELPPSPPRPSDTASELSAEPPAPLPEDLHLEDERSPMDWEDDHSDTDFDLPPLGHPRAPVVASAAASASTDVSLDDIPYPEDERPCLDHEDDHSDTNFDMNEELDAKLGKLDPAAESESKDAFDAEEGSSLHPGLLAALKTSYNYAESLREAERRAASPEEREEAARNTDALGIDDDDDDFPMEPEDSGEDDGLPPDAAEPSEAPTSAATASDAAETPADELTIDSAAAAAAVAASIKASQGNTPGEEPAPKPDIYTPPSTQKKPPVAVDDDDDEEEDDDEREDRPMTLGDHLRELRKRLFRSFLWVLGGFGICYPFAETLFAWLFQPLMTHLPEASKLIYTTPPEAFFVFLKVAFVGGIFITSPMIFYQVWAFVAPGLYKEEKLYILPIAFFSALFFISGGAFCYFLVFDFAFEFFMSYSTGLIQAMPALSETLSFVLQLLLAFGLVFELPLFVFFLAKIGIVTADMMRRFRRYAVLLSVIVGAILTPPDVVSQLLMAGPLLLLYELSIFIAVLVGKKKTDKEAEKDKDEDDDADEDDKITDGTGVRRV